MRTMIALRCRCSLSRSLQLCIIILIVSPAAATQLSDDAVAEFRSTLQQFLRRVYEEKTYETIFLLRDVFEHCVDENLEQISPVPVINAGPGMSMQLRGRYSREMLAIACPSSLKDYELMHRLAKILDNMRDTRLIVIVNGDLSARSMRHRYLKDFFKVSMKLKFVHVILVHRDFGRTETIHSFTHWPEFALEVQNLSASGQIFPYRLGNFGGKVVTVLPDQIEPRSMLHTDPSGHRHLLGFVSKVVIAFAEHYNCTLQVPTHIEDGHAIHLSEVREAAQNGSVDIGISISPISVENKYLFTYPFDLSWWRTMVPVESPVPISMLFFNNLSRGLKVVCLVTYVLLSLLLAVAQHSRHGKYSRISVCSVLLNDNCIRGIMGQTFPLEKRPAPLVKFIYLLIFITGVFISSSYGANFMMQLTAPPSQKPVNNFEDAKRQKMKILFPKEEIPAIAVYTNESFLEEYRSVFIGTDTYDEFQLLRHSLDTRYAYSVSPNIWSIVQEKQKSLPRNLFRLANQMTFFEDIPYGLPVANNSPYKKSLDELVFTLYDSGLIKHWETMSFYEMVRIGRLSLGHLSMPTEYRSMQFGDFALVWIVFAVGLALCTLVFLAEKIVYARSHKKRLRGE